VHAAEKAAVDLCCRASRDAATTAGVQQLWFQVMQVGASPCTAYPFAALSLDPQLRADFRARYLHVFPA